LQRPTRSNLTITETATGVYLCKYAQAGLSIVSARADVVLASAIIGSGSTSFNTAVPGYAVISGDFMSGGTSYYAADSTQTTFVILCIVAANNALGHVYGLGNTSSVANYRISYDVVMSTSTYNQ
jgi:hypothetical protein